MREHTKRIVKKLADAKIEFEVLAAKTENRDDKIKCGGVIYGVGGYFTKNYPNSKNTYKLMYVRKKQKDKFLADKDVISHDERVVNLRAETIIDNYKNPPKKRNAA